MKEYKFKAEELEAQISHLTEKGITELSVTDEKVARDKNRLLRLMKLVAQHRKGRSAAWRQARAPGSLLPEAPYWKDRRRYPCRRFPQTADIPGTGRPALSGNGESEATSRLSVSARRTALSRRRFS